jgi:Neuraminidase (sialidase)
MEIDTNTGSSFKNNIYVSTTQFASNSNSQIWVSHSSDGGKTWTSKAVSALAMYPTSVNQFSDLAVGADGTVYANWINCPANNGVSPYCGGQKTSIMFSKSTDGGNTWSKPTTAATVTLVTDNGCCFYGQLPNTSERVSDIPSNAVFGSGSTAKVFVSVYTWTGTQMQQEVVTSSDGGTTWGTPVKVNASSTKGDQFFQWLNVNSAGTLGVTWLDRRNDTANLSYQPFFAFSKNSGASFSKGHALSSKKSNPNNDGFGGSFMGDYTGNAWQGTKTLYQSYMDTTTNTCQDFVTGVQFP